MPCLQTWLTVGYGVFPLHGMANYGSVRFTFGSFSTGYSTWYFFLVPLRPRFQVNRTVTKMWSVNSADHGLAGENCPYLRHLTVDKQKRTARFKSAQPGKDRTQLFWTSAPFLTTQKWLYHCLLRKYRRSSHWYQRSRSSESLMGWRGMKKFFTSHGSRGGRAAWLTEMELKSWFNEIYFMRIFQRSTVLWSAVNLHPKARQRSCAENPNMPQRRNPGNAYHCSWINRRFNCFHWFNMTNKHDYDNIWCIWVLLIILY